MAASDSLKIDRRTDLAIAEVVFTRDGIERLRDSLGPDEARREECNAWIESLWRLELELTRLANDDLRHRTELNRVRRVAGFNAQDDVAYIDALGPDWKLAIRDVEEARVTYVAKAIADAARHGHTAKHVRLLVAIYNQHRAAFKSPAALFDRLTKHHVDTDPFFSWGGRGVGPPSGYIEARGRHFRACQREGRSEEEIRRLWIDEVYARLVPNAPDAVAPAVGENSGTPQPARA